MTLKIEGKVDLAKYRIKKTTKRNLDDAKKLFELGSFNSSVNRVYYAVLLALRLIQKSMME